MQEKDKLINYRDRKVPNKCFKCIKPTKLLTKHKEYKGFIQEQYLWVNNSYKKFIHVINDRGQHRSYDTKRFKEL